MHGSPTPPGLMVGLHFLPLEVSGGPRELAVMLDSVRSGPASGQKLGSDVWFPSSCRQGGLLSLLWELHMRSPSEGMTFLRTPPGPRYPEFFPPALVGIQPLPSPHGGGSSLPPALWGLTHMCAGHCRLRPRGSTAVRSLCRCPRPGAPFCTFWPPSPLPERSVSVHGPSCSASQELPRP